MTTHRITPFLAFVIGSFFLLVANAVRADLVWDEASGWRIEGGVFSGLNAGPDARNAKELMDKARIAEERKRFSSAIDTYKKVTKRYPKSIYAPEAYFRMGKLQVKKRQYFKAFESMQIAVASYPNYERYSEVIAYQYAIAKALDKGARNYYWGFIPGGSSKSRALQYYEVVVANAPHGEFGPQALLNASRLYLKNDDDIFAIDALDRIINNYPGHPLTARAYIEIANTYASLVDGSDYDQKATSEAITYYQDFLILFPGDPEVPAAEAGLAKMKTILARGKLSMGEFYDFKRDNFDAAKVLYNEAITVYPDSDVAKEARARLEKLDLRRADLIRRQVEKKPEKKFLGIF